MDSVKIENFRCFKQSQEAKLTRLTLLVGENSTGKSSLMAMVRILWHSALYFKIKPSFKEDPFDLGTYTDVVHGNAGEEFTGEISIDDYKSKIVFRKGAVDPEVKKIHIKNNKVSITFDFSIGEIIAQVTSSGESYKIDLNKVDKSVSVKGTLNTDEILLFKFIDYLEGEKIKKDYPELANNLELIRVIFDLCLEPYSILREKYDADNVFFPPWVSSPFQENPQRVYTAGGGKLDPRGGKIPAYLAELASSNAEDWRKTKDTIESFGRKTGVFDHMRIRHLGDDESRDPFQIQVRKSDGNWRNLIDVGFGVSQLLPFLFHLARPTEEYLLNFQQPEVHLHPSAQAGLGALLCEAATKRQILVETHSDFLINRVRMDIRDRKTNLKPEDVSILYFERVDTDEVKIHNITIDQNGNLIDSPPSYREFFTQELNRSLGI